MNGNDTKPELPIHKILRGSDYARTKVPEMSRVGSPGEPVAELTRFRWVIMSPGNEITLNNLMLLRTSMDDYEQRCNLDVLEVQDIPKTHEDIVHTNFQVTIKAKLRRMVRNRTYVKKVKENLQNNKTGCLRRLQNLIVKLQK